MERYSLILIADETSPVRRYDVRRVLIKRVAIAAAGFACLLAVGLVDYVRVRVDYGSLAVLRQENARQRAEIEGFGETLSAVEVDLQRLREFERKVRIIANLPGSVASGGESVVAVGAATGGDLDAAENGTAGVADAVGEARTPEATVPEAAPAAVSDEPPGDRVSALRTEAERLGADAQLREESLTELLGGLEEKRNHLSSTPAIWPAKGWMTSRFGNRISPFTGARQFHGGIDIAGARGTDVISPARGRITHVGKRGALGLSVRIDHGYGIRTLFGHTDEAFVERGQEVERGQVIASMGNSGRSTGPHLHYAVEVNGKAVNPINYIFD